MERSNQLSIERVFREIARHVGRLFERMLVERAAELRDLQAGRLCELELPDRAVGQLEDEEDLLPPDDVVSEPGRELLSNQRPVGCNSSRGNEQPAKRRTPPLQDLDSEIAEFPIRYRGPTHEEAQVLLLAWNHRVSSPRRTSRSAQR